MRLSEAIRLGDAADRIAQRLGAVMGYFSNGSEGMDYEARWCDRCVHQQADDGGCPVWLAHMLHNYEECRNDKSILHLLIPRSPDGLTNEQCVMFWPSR